ncbi:hypothetical protein PFICI_11739 [Pestalotiopsis fici W106-1]|uniref:DUF3176 domain containing protein n=1 Tax=Pestalotiopsis fici (strain W106-1 / CGMCC3.15140) TaxID=1229662 RepID=W3WT83_PESFW|nr:uncharacterized protein PFICI_11739 [Pestalotiopsis fici W106-1]ETS76352.1 hypothetical protein PFICI_11739 [Pestalotiopsis fici W106-1]
MDEIIHSPTRANHSHQKSPGGLEQQSAPSSRRNSIPSEEAARYGESVEQTAEVTFVTYHQTPTHSSPLLRQDSGSASINGFQSLDTQDDARNDGSVKTDQETRPKSPHTWKLEMSAVALSLTAMTTLLVLLVLANNRPLDKWRFLISFNALISILGAVARAPLGFVMGSCLGQAKWNWFKRQPGRLEGFEKFEDASRGPLGSFVFLFWLPARHWSVLGALMTVVLLGFDPFLQAIVDYDGQLDDSNSLKPPTIGVCERLDVGSYSYLTTRGEAGSFQLPSGNAIDRFIWSKIPDVGMTAALIDGLGNDTKRTEPMASFVCPSGNCTWAPYSTLAICSTCNDVTASLEQNEILGGKTLYSLPYVESIDEKKGIFAETADMAAAAVSNPGLTVSFQKSNTLIAAVGIIRFPDKYHLNPLAKECALYFCIKAFATRVDNGVFKESVIDTWSDRNLASYQPGMPEWEVGMEASTFAEYESWNNNSLVNSEVNFHRFDLQLRWSDERARQVGLPKDAIMAFNISQSSAETTSYAVTDQLFSSGQLVSWPIPRTGFNGTLYPFVAQVLGTKQTQDYDAVFENMAQRMTTFMRDQSDSTQTGQQKEWALHIRVRWAYLILPLLVVVGACLVLLFAILETNHRRLEPWKSDVLATFTHSVDAETQKQLRLAELTGQARETAKNTFVSLVDTGEFVELKVKKD